MSTEIKKKNFYAAKEFAEMCNVSRSLIYNAIADEKIKVKRIGKRILIPAEYVEHFVNDY